ncbi:MAG: YraN family protein [Clostridiales bacterium]|nr:YraN family protein [Clostridiales bacterium]
MQDTPKNFYKKLLGRVGENKAVNHLKKEGYKILKTNYKTRFGEADIIAEKDETIVFIEVKTRKDSAFGAPSEAVNRTKQEKYKKVAEEFLLKNRFLERNSRFDVIEVENGEINHIIDAFWC